MNIAKIGVIGSKFFRSIIFLILPVKHILDFWATIPTISPPIREIIRGACILPGPFWLTANNPVVTALNTNKIIRATGNIYPFSCLISTFFSSL